MVNHATNESTIMISPLMFEGILATLPVVNVTEYDEEMKIYTIYNETVPHFFGEGKTPEEAARNMVKKAIEFSREYMENTGTFSRLFNGIQQFMIGAVLLNIDDEKKIAEILRLA
jgi:predicted RNase H-like HicB family nuclease